MNFLEKSVFLNTIVQELAYVAPNDWSRIVYYTERLYDIDVGLRNASTSKCWIGKDKKKYDTSQGPALKVSVELSDAIGEFYEASKDEEKLWCALGIILESNGKYFSQFYYEDTPLLDNDLEKYTLRLKDLSEMSL